MSVKIIFNKNINLEKFHRELGEAGFGSISSVPGEYTVVHGTDDQAAVIAIYNAHDPTPDAQPAYIEYEKPIKAPDFIVATPKIADDPEVALDDAIREIEKGDGNPKSLYVISAGIAKYLKAKRIKLR